MLMRWAVLGVGTGTGDLVAPVVFIGVLLISIIGMWKVFEKAGQPGWGAIIPIYNLYLLCKIAGRPGWWVLLFFLPIISIVFAIILSLDIAKAFGKGVGFAIGLILLSFVFYPILGFGDAQYQGPTAQM